MTHESYLIRVNNKDTAGLDRSKIEGFEFNQVFFIGVQRQQTEPHDMARTIVAHTDFDWGYFSAIIIRLMKEYPAFAQEFGKKMAKDLQEVLEKAGGKP